MNNEIQKLRKELSDLSIVSGYENAPSGRYSRFKKKLDLEGGLLTNSLPPDDQNEEDSDEKENSTYACNRIDLDKKFFLSTQICNYSDEDKIKDMLEAYNCKNLPDITLNLTASNKDSLIIDSFFHSPEIQMIPDNMAPLSDDDYKSMTPTTLDNEDDEPDVEKDEKKLDEIKRLEGELEKYKENFDRERIKWIEEKEKVLVYQRQLQANYLEMSKRTQVLEEKLRKIEKN